MIRRWRRGLVLAAVGAAAIVAGVLLATQPWSDETAVQEAAGQPVEHRACNVVFQVPPESSQFEIIPIAMWPANDGRPSLIVRMKRARMITDPQTGELTDETPGVFMDAETGEILSETYYTPSDEVLLREMLATIRVEPFNPATAPWPYSDATTAPIKLEKVPPNGGVEVRLPDPDSGLVVTYVSGNTEMIRLTSCNTIMQVELGTGAIFGPGIRPIDPDDTIDPDDAAAFETFRAAVEASGR